MSQGKHIYFASDFHLGLPSFLESRNRELMAVQWLDSIKADASEIFLVGDIFDFWYEYQRVIPKGFTRFMGKVAELTDSGIPVHFFTGNHDVWMFGYFEQELGVTIHTQTITREFHGKRFEIGHGDGLGKGDNGYKLLKGVFGNRAAQWLFARLHPNFSMWLGNRWSLNSRNSKEVSRPFQGETEMITGYARREIARGNPCDYFIFGHWHSPVVYPLTEDQTLVLLGDWIVNFTFGRWNGSQFELFRYSNPESWQLIGKK